MNSRLVYTHIITTVVLLNQAWSRDPDLTVTSVSVSDRTVNPGQLVTVSYTIKNIGNKGSWYTSTGLMWSTNSTISRGDHRIIANSLAPLGDGNSRNQNQIIAIPSNATFGATYYVGAYADYNQTSDESRENNNGRGISVTINDDRPDLVAENLTVSNSEASYLLREKLTSFTGGRNENVYLHWTARNRGLKGSTPCAQAIIWSSDPQVTRADGAEETDTLLALFAGNTREQGQNFEIPSDAIIGHTYYLGVYTDFNQTVDEQRENNNVSNTIPFKIHGPDLIAQDLTVSENITEHTLGFKDTQYRGFPGESLYFHWTAKNQGGKGSGYTKQAIIFSDDPNIDRTSPHRETDTLAPLFSGNDREQGQVFKIPESATPGDTYYVGVYEDFETEEDEEDETNNLSNVVTINVIHPTTVSRFELSDYNYLPDLDPDDDRLQDTSNDRDPNPGATMNPSRCFAPGDRAYIHATAVHDLEFLGLSTGRETRLRAWYNTTPTDAGATYIGKIQQDVGGIVDRRLNLPWTVPNSPGNYYLKVAMEVEYEAGTWTSVRSAWLDDGDPVVVSEGLPIILVHGWSDTDGNTFHHLETLLEVELNRPVRFFQYETSKFPLVGSGDGPRIDQGYEGKPSLADQLEDFLAKPEGDANRPLVEVDIVAHSMGGLVVKNYALKSGQKIRRLVTLGTPSYGGLFADTLGGILNNQAEDLEHGSPLTWKLHHEWLRRADDMPDLFTIVATNDDLPGIYNQSDKVVLCTSGSMENLGYPTYYVPLHHSGEEGMTHIDDHTHESWEPIRAFLSNAEPEVVGALPGHGGGRDDVGHRSHPDPLTAGSLYVVGPRSTAYSIEPISQVTLDADFTLFGQQDVNRHGIYFANGVVATNAVDGSERYSTVSVQADSRGATFREKIRVKAGETTVYVINGLNPHLDETSDSDGDLIPDARENRLIDALLGDAYADHHAIGPNTDIDGDGLTEWAELALGTSSLVRDEDVFQKRLEAGFLYLRHPESLLPTRLKLTAQQSTDLQGWSPEGVVRQVIETHANHRVVEWSIPDAGSRGFLQVMIEASP